MKKLGKLLFFLNLILLGPLSAQDPPMDHAPKAGAQQTVHPVTTVPPRPVCSAPDDNAVLFIDYNDRHNKFGTTLSQIKRLCSGECAPFSVPQDQFRSLSPDEVSTGRIAAEAFQLAHRLADKAQPRLILLIDSHGEPCRLTHDKRGDIPYQKIFGELFEALESVPHFRSKAIIDVYIDSCSGRTATQPLKDAIGNGPVTNSDASESYGWRVNLLTGADSGESTQYSQFWDAIEVIAEEHRMHSHSEAHAKVNFPEDSESLFCDEALGIGAEINRHRVWSSYRKVRAYTGERAGFRFLVNALVAALKTKSPVSPEATQRLVERILFELKKGYLTTEDSNALSEQLTEAVATSTNPALGEVRLAPLFFAVIPDWPSWWERALQRKPPQEAVRLITVFKDQQFSAPEIQTLFAYFSELDPAGRDTVAGIAGHPFLPSDVRPVYLANRKLFIRHLLQSTQRPETRWSSNIRPLIKWDPEPDKVLEDVLIRLKNPAARLAVFRVLQSMEGEIKPPFASFVPLLARGIADQDPQVRETTLSTLAHFVSRSEASEKRSFLPLLALLSPLQDFTATWLVERLKEVEAQETGAR